MDRYGCSNQTHLQVNANSAADKPDKPHFESANGPRRRVTGFNAESQQTASFSLTHFQRNRCNPIRHAHTDRSRHGYKYRVENYPLKCVQGWRDRRAAGQRWHFREDVALRLETLPDAKARWSPPARRRAPRPRRIPPSPGKGDLHRLPRCIVRVRT